MHKGRLEAFSDGVIAIIITVMVIELHPPHGADLREIMHMAPKLFSYLLSFVFVGIYWNNHHHTLQATEKVNGAVLWANMHLLFWLSLIPLATAWMGETEFREGPVAFYGVILVLCAVAYTILARSLTALHGRDSKLAKALGDDRKGKLSLALYIAAVPLAFVHPGIAGLLYVTVAIIWLVPDKRIERVLADKH